MPDSFLKKLKLLSQSLGKNPLNHICYLETAYQKSFHNLNPDTIHLLKVDKRAETAFQRLRSYVVSLQGNARSGDAEGQDIFFVYLKRLEDTHLNVHDGSLYIATYVGPKRVLSRESKGGIGWHSGSVWPQRLGDSGTSWPRMLKAGHGHNSGSGIFTFSSSSWTGWMSIPGPEAYFSTAVQSGFPAFAFCPFRRQVYHAAAF